MKERFEWIDIAKGLAMLCIIAGHMGIDTVNRIVFTFHVPIFFLISGYFISRKLSLKEYVIKRAKGLIIPYLFTSFLLMIAKIPIDIVKGKSDCIFADMRTVFIRAVYGSGTNANKTILGIQQIGAIWFLLALFWALVLVKILIDKKYGWVWIVLVATISYISALYVWLPWDIQAGGTAAIFVYIGAYIKKRNVNVTFRWWLILIGIIYWGLEVSFDISLSVARNYYKYTVISVVGAILISYVLLWGSKLLDSTKIIKRCLCYIGANSIIFLCFHLVELNNVPWDVVYSLLENFPLAFQYFICFVCKLLFITACTVIILKTKRLRRIFSK